MAGNKKNVENLGRKQEAAMLALLVSRNVEETPRTAGVSARALYRWMKEPAFDAAYRAARRAAFGQAVSRLQYASSAAAATLLKVMLDASTPASTKVRAADSVLSHTLKAMEDDDIIVRVNDS